MTVRRLGLFFLATSLSAQWPIPRVPGTGIPGSPYPGGGQYPGSGRRAPRRSGQDQGRDERPKLEHRDEVKTATTGGILRRYSPGQLVIQAGDHRIVWYRISDKTTFRKEGKEADPQQFELGDHLTVDSTSDDEGNFTAADVTWLRTGTRDEKTAAVQTWDLPAPESGDAGAPPVTRDEREDRQQQTETAEAEPDYDPVPPTIEKPPPPPREQDDPGRPVLRRSSSKQQPARASMSSGEPAEPPPSRPAVVVEEDLITRAREAAARFINSLPDFLCQQITTRYSSESRKEGWDAIDTVTADVTYEDGRETYKNIRVNNGAVRDSMDEVGGSHSTGEFGTVMLSLLAPATQAEFRRSGTDTIGGREAVVYAFKVPRETSRWRIIAPSQLYVPAYDGSVWIDRKTARVLRVEQGSRNMPSVFPFDTAETAVDYGFVRLSDAESALLPVDAEILTCQQGTSYCVRNRIEFHNYRKFGSDSNITYEKP